MTMNLLKRNMFRPNLVGVGLVAVTSAAVCGGGILMVVRTETEGKVERER